MADPVYATSDVHKVITGYHRGIEIRLCEHCLYEAVMPSGKVLITNSYGVMEQAIDHYFG